MNVMADLNLIAPLLVPCIAAGIILLLTVAGGAHRPAPPKRQSPHLDSTHRSWNLGLDAGPAHWCCQGVFGRHCGGRRQRALGLTAIVGGMLSVVLSAGYLREHELSLRIGTLAVGRGGNADVDDGGGFNDPVYRYRNDVDRHLRPCWLSPRVASFPRSCA